MLANKAKSIDKAAASVDMGGEFKSGARGGGVFNVKCFDKDGNLKWEENAHNLVVNEGLQLMNDEFFTGSSYTFFSGDLPLIKFPTLNSLDFIVLVVWIFFEFRFQTKQTKWVKKI
jgi:hypothetical protein